MAISDRISAMYDHVEDIYDTMALGGDTTSNKNIVNINTEIKREYKDFLANGTDTLWNNWEKVSGTGETLSLTPTIKGKMKVDLKGNTYQYSTTGKNLFGYGITAVDNTASYRPNQYQRLLLSATANPNEVKFNYNGTYCFGYIEMNGIDGTLPYSISFNIKENTTNYTPSMAVDTTNSTNQKLVIIINGNNKGTNTGSSNYFILTNIQVESGSTITPYEPYTGGQPSPSPSYPQDIQVVSGDNTIKVEGKNLFNPNTSMVKQVSNFASNNILNATTNTSISINSQNYLTGTSNNYIVVATPFDYIKGKTIYNVGYKGSRKMIVYDNTGAVLEVFYPYDSPYTPSSNFSGYLGVGIDTNKNVDNEYIQISYDINATYQEYQGQQTYPISLGNIELCKIGTYQDKIAKSSGKNLLNPVFEKGRLDDGVVGYAEGVSSLTNTNNSITFTTNTSWRGITSDFIEVKSGTYILIRGTKDNNNLSVGAVAYYDDNKNFIQNRDNTATNYGWRAFNNTNAKYVRICFILSTSGTATITNPQVEFGEEPTDFEPYGTSWYLHKEIGKYTITGQENIYLLATLTNVVRFEVINIINSISASQCYSNYFKWYSNQATNNNFNAVDGEAIHIRDNANSVGIKISKDICTTLEQFQTWLSTHNTEVYYVLATPTYEEITDSSLKEQLNNLENAMSYDEQTNISQVNDDLPFILDITALKEVS